MSRSFAFLLLFLAGQAPSIAGQPTHGREVERWKVHEIVLQGRAAENPFMDTDLYGHFYQDGDTTIVRGFYDGDGVYRIRFSPSQIGKWSYHTVSNQQELNQRSVQFACVPPRPANRGPVSVVNTFGFEYADGSPYFPFGTTLYAWAHQSDSLQQRTLHTLSKGYFNKVRMCVFPKAYWWNQGEPALYPFEGEALEDWDFTRFYPEFFQNLEQQIGALDALGIEVDLILFHPYDRWGFSKMGSVANHRYLDYVVARLAAYKNVWWSLANEFDFIEGISMEDWESLIGHLDRRDVYGRLKSIHNGVAMFDHSDARLSHVSVQTDDLAAVSALRDAFGKPVIVDECGYEGDIPWFWGQLSPQELVARHWEGVVRGGYVSHGETYLENIRTDQRVEENDDVLWWSKGGVLHGESPARIAFLRQVVESGAGSRHDSPDDYLVYFGMSQPALHLFDFAGDATYEITVIDTWNMTQQTLPERYSGYSLVSLPGQPYTALRVKALPGDGE